MNLDEISCPAICSLESTKHRTRWEMPGEESQWFCRHCGEELEDDIAECNCGFDGPVWFD